MTKQEVIKNLRLIKSTVYLGNRKFLDALDCAIELLAQPEPCEDTISRQAAIDIDGLDEQIRCEMCRNPMHTDRGCDGNCKYDEKLYERIMQILGERIKPLPSAQPEQRWIPCSERLPDDDTLMLVNYIDNRPEAMDIWIGWHEMENVWYIDGEAHSKEDGNEVIAWMPLPEPYREEGEQE